MSLSYDILFYTPFVFVFLYLFAHLIARTPRNVCIVVLGDIGRSPRMQYHALSFAQEGYRVFLVGYKGSRPQKVLLDNEQISIHHVRELPGFVQVLPRLVGYIVKVMWQATTLATTLLLLPKMSTILIQNPPSIPTMAVSYGVSLVKFADFVIDWHNYGHTILALSLGESHPLVKFSKRYEKFCARLSSYNICVTQAMREDLRHSWNIESSVVYDRPPAIFRAASLEEQHALFEKLSQDYPVFGHSEKMEKSETMTAFTKKAQDGTVTKLETRPTLLVSSTSWTEDEDFGVLLSALEAYDENKRTEKDLPDLLCVITGKGPQKEFYREKISGREWTSVQFCLPWLEAEDYPVLLGCADLGVCLHTSSSGLDLPMKVVDMFGCGLPVCAIDFKCIGELVQHGKNGLVFTDSHQLTSQLKDLLQGFPSHTKQLDAFRENLAWFQSQRWHECWQKSVLPIFKEIGNRHSVSPKYDDDKDKSTGLRDKKDQ